MIVIWTMSDEQSNNSLSLQSQLFQLANTIHNMEEPNIGKIIKEVLAQQGRSITWLAQQMGTTRNLVYKMFDREIIYTDRLLQISQLLDYDFFKCYSDYIKEKKKESFNLEQ